MSKYEDLRNKKLKVQDDIDNLISENKDFYKKIIYDDHIIISWESDEGEQLFKREDNLKMKDILGVRNYHHIEDYENKENEKSNEPILNKKR